MQPGQVAHATLQLREKLIKSIATHAHQFLKVCLYVFIILVGLIWHAWSRYGEVINTQTAHIISTEGMPGDNSRASSKDDWYGLRVVVSPAKLIADEATRDKCPAADLIDVAYALIQMHNVCGTLSGRYFPRAHLRQPVSTALANQQQFPGAGAFNSIIYVTKAGPI